MTDFKSAGLSLMTLLLSACASTTINISTSPQNARVLLRTLDKGELVDVGETPLTLDSKRISKYRKSSGPVMMELQKPGFHTEKILITEFSQIDLSIHETLKPTAGLEDSQGLNIAIDHLFEAQRLAKQNRLDDALKELDEVSHMSGDIAAFYELRGGIYFLQKKYQPALDDYNRLLQLTPKNPEAHALQRQLQDIIGGKSDAGKIQK